MSNANTKAREIGLALGIDTEADLWINITEPVLIKALQEFGEEKKCEGIDETEKILGDKLAEGFQRDLAEGIRRGVSVGYAKALEDAAKEFNHICNQPIMTKCVYCETQRKIRALAAPKGDTL